MTSDVLDIFSRFYQLVEDYKLAGLEEDLANEILSGYLRQTLSKPYVRKLFRGLSYDSDVGEVEYSMRESWDDASDQDFVEQMLALGMICEWLSPKYHSVLNTAQMFSNKDLMYFSQANHMAELNSMYTKAQTDFRKFVRDRGYGLRLVNSE